MMLRTILDTLESSGCTAPEIDLLQPADPFLDTTGEDLRRRIFITQENSGRTLCLRPEFTIPVCLGHLERGWIKARYAYGGKVFRQRADGVGEFTQAGFENLGSRNFNDADIDCILTSIRVLEAVGQSGLSMVLGDQQIFVSALDALQIPQAWKKKLIRSFGDDELLLAHLDAMSSAGHEPFAEASGAVREAIASGEVDALATLLTEQMVEDGLPLSGGRTARAIADRMIEKAELASQRLDAGKRAALETFLGIDVPLAEAADAIATFEKENGIMIPLAGEELAARYEGLKDADLSMRYRASFGRQLDYYTGFVFEIFRSGHEKPLVGGGRYDRLMTLLGSPEEIPAVGFSVWVDRLEGGRVA
jgi:ATP phosphoribosyltransferase regulatory subunit